MFKSIFNTGDLSDPTLIEDWNFNFRMDTFPLIEKELSYDSAVEERIFELGRKKINAVFTSEVAVRSVFERLEEKPDWNIYCLSGKTRATLLKFIPDAGICGMGSNSTVLADFIKENPAPLREYPTVFFCGDRRMPTLPAAFEQIDTALEELVCYKTSCCPSRIRGDIDGFLFFSPSAVECYFAHNQEISQNAVLFAIGQTTAKSIAAHCTNKVIVAPEPSERALLNEVKIYFEAQQKLEK